MKIIADENMALVRELFGDLGELTCLPGRSISPEDVAEADVLLVRSVTRVDAALLAGSRIRFVGTATIGTDHLDLPWLSRAGIVTASAPGCNARSVVEYVWRPYSIFGGATGLIGIGGFSGWWDWAMSAPGWPEPCRVWV